MASTPDSGVGGDGGTLFRRVARALGSEPRDLDELRGLILDAQRRELLGHDAHKMIEGVFQVADMRARDIMVPRSQMVVVEDDAELTDMLPAIIESGHSRFPVIDDNRDEVVGVLLAKDLLRYCTEEERTRFDIRDVMRAAVFVPESKRLNTLLQDFRSSRNHMAVVVDEYGGTAGLVTIEDILEQIVGDIDDEHDSEEDFAIREQAPGAFSVDALTEIEEFNNFFGTEFGDDDFDTIGGLVSHQLGHVPASGESIVLDGLHFRVLDADSRRVREFQVTVRRADADAGDPPSMDAADQKR